MLMFFLRNVIFIWLHTCTSHKNVSCEHTGLFSVSWLAFITLFVYIYWWACFCVLNRIDLILIPVWHMKGNNKGFRFQYRFSCPELKQADHNPQGWVCFEKR